MSTENDNKKNGNLPISDVMNSIILNNFEISLINVLNFNIKDILIVREQQKQYKEEWLKKYYS